jgi:hypothetical protein
MCRSIAGSVVNRALETFLRSYLIPYHSKFVPDSPSHSSLIFEGKAGALLSGAPYELHPKGRLLALARNFTEIQVINLSDLLSCCPSILQMITFDITTLVIMTLGITDDSDLFGLNVS